MTTHADIKLVIDQLNNLEVVHDYDENVTDDAAQMLAALGNQIAAQAAVIEKLRGALKFYANPASDTFGNTARLALDTPTDSAQILQEWLDSVLGEPESYEFQDTEGKWRPFLDQRHFDNTKKDGRWPIRGLYIKLEKL